MTTVPIISIIGRKNSGKTQLVVALVSEIKRRGFRVATIKHDAHEFDIDVEGKDSWQHALAGAETVIISSQSKIGVTRTVGHEQSIDELAHAYVPEGIDIVITEGYRGADKAKIEVWREELRQEPISTTERRNLIGFVSNTPLDLGVVQFAPGEVEAIVDFIERRFLR